MSDSLQPHGLQPVRLPCPSLSPRVCSNSWSLSPWCHPSHLISHPFLLLPSTSASTRVFSNEPGLHITWPKCWSFSFSISPCPSNEYLGLISFRIDWLDLRAVQGPLESSLISLNCSTTIQKHQFFGAQPSLWSSFHLRTWLLEKP